MDNSSIAAFIETNRKRMNSVIICLPSKGPGQEKRNNTQIYYRKVGRSGEGGSSQKKLLTPCNRDEWQAHGLGVSILTEINVNV